MLSGGSKASVVSVDKERASMAVSIGRQKFDVSYCIGRNLDPINVDSTCAGSA